MQLILMKWNLFIEMINRSKRQSETAFRCGLWLALVGTFFIVILDAFDSYRHIMTFVDNDIYLVVCFIAGMLTARKIGLLKHASLAGRWAAFFSVLFGLVYEAIVHLFQFVAFHTLPKFITDIDFRDASSLLLLIFLVPITCAVLAFGTVMTMLICGIIGSLGGLLGKAMFRKASSPGKY
ncbi:hypothetical protein [Dictyobacter halimunensis]|uniref:hypothetical protein n=1 Tax=Dictyobacter halimunensis TaxID=3026934 RepID=UPI0030C724AC